ncbi:hypothetical protein GUJ93_ZPchr0012g20395 [Zizania palustris]|uniref:Uncharacterized protein n=1 Tax=Zizania palustris TaxID=103762 RepID=A0A8J5WQ52_ZIZPA|nr:hypothetical protein GUJ93_ZPchr0012g20395 [Zizania palustris]
MDLRRVPRPSSGGVEPQVPPYRKVGFFMSSEPASAAALTTPPASAPTEVSSSSLPRYVLSRGSLCAVMIQLPRIPDHPLLPSSPPPPSSTRLDAASYHDDVS